ncbi:patatin-like phospholipase family protein [Aquirufa aurantiipilula]|uniref:Patatin-like phospholipase family protein n=1 Tax=Aquirufa aurantiipilula TaxID=2696561 RepID=A0ABT6BKA1_9BACT|nr:patatin-like phospholipase family protein [Aquirufa aurantiipilula]MBZ1326628.1 esterase [Aquirufa aurantiipilula]MDF5690799.1 patatin-like phospholipase family protein [Aquirufa aurantiipilula]
MSLKKKVHLVLGSGGARGFAHMGVIDVLEEHNFEIISVTGCSMGAVVGGIYAAGFHEAYKKWALGLTKSKVFSLLDFTLGKHGFVKGERIFDVLSQFINVPQIEDFRIPFTAVAADMHTKKEVWFQSGDLYRALRASIAIPGIFTPVIDGEHVLVDGGVLNPLPLNVVNRQAGEMIVAVDLNGDAPFFVLPEKNESEDLALLKGIKEWLGKNWPSPAPTDLSTLASTKSLSDILFYSYEMTQDRVTEMMVDKYRPDILIEIPKSISSIFEFDRAEELIEYGREACLKAIVASEKTINNHEK